MHTSLVSGLVFDTFLEHDVPSGVTKEHSKRVCCPHASRTGTEQQARGGTAMAKVGHLPWLPGLKPTPDSSYSFSCFPIKNFQFNSVSLFSYLVLKSTRSSIRHAVFPVRDPGRLPHITSPAPHLPTEGSCNNGPHGLVQPRPGLQTASSGSVRCLFQCQIQSTHPLLPKLPPNFVSEKRNG